MTSSRQAPRAQLGERPWALRYGEHLESVKRHVEAGLAVAGLGGVAIYAGRQRERFLDDHPYPFAANPHFQWWLPLGSHPECWIYFEPGERPRLIFFQPDDYWHQPPQDPAGFWCECFDIRVVREPGEARQHLPTQLADVGVIGEADLLPDWEFATHNPEPLLAYLHWQRGRKTPYELDCLRGASELAAQAHRAAAAAFRDGGSEYAIHSAYLQALRAVDHDLPYTNIVALNEHAAVLHYQHRRRSAPQPRHSFLIDAGACYQGYASDITRTYAAAEGEFADLIAAMDGRQQQLAAQVRSGVDFADLHRSAHRAVAELLADLKIVRLDADAIIERGISSTFLPHGLGHFLGLQVHDVGGHQATESGGRNPPPPEHPYLRLTRTLEPGHVVTIEPGLYFIDPLLSVLRAGPNGKHVNWEAVEYFRPHGGIRIEDDVVVTGGDPENLTRDAFAALP